MKIDIRLGCCVSFACSIFVLLATACGGGGAGDSEESNAVHTQPGRIVFLGDSLTKGQGVPEADAYPSRIQARLDQEGLTFEVENSGVSGDTSGDALNRLDSIIALPVSILVLALGANDAEDGVPAAGAEANLNEIIYRVRASWPDAKIVVAGVNHPELMSASQISAYTEMYRTLAEAQHTEFLPDLLAGVMNNSALIQADGIHPNSTGHSVIAENVWSVIEPLVRLHKSLGRGNI